MLAAACTEQQWCCRRMQGRLPLGAHSHDLERCTVSRSQPLQLHSGSVHAGDGACGLQQMQCQTALSLVQLVSHPGLQGMVAVACTEPLSFSERVEVAGTPKAHAVLIWNFKDPIHPEVVLESPFEVFSFQCNPAQPDAVAGGCHNGQVILWDVSVGEVGAGGGP